MKLNYQIKTISNLNNEELINSARDELNKKGYEIQNESSKSIKFSLAGWGSRGEQFGKVYDGEIEIFTQSNLNNVKFSYRISLMINCIAIAVFAVLGLFIGPPFLFLSIVTIIGSIIQILSTNSKCKILLNDIVNP